MNSGSRSRPSAWIARFLDRPENEFLCPVDDSFVRDRFNLIGLDELVPGFELALCTVLDDTGAIGARGKRAAELLYGLVHARYIMTPQGVAKMLAKHEAGCFGHCPRVYCDHSLALPIGLHNVAGRDTVKLYCPRCKDVYVPASGTRGATVDGAFFGTGFPHMAFMTRPEYRPGGRYVAKLYGFRIYESEENRQSALLPNGDVVRHTLLPRP